MADIKDCRSCIYETRSTFTEPCVSYEDVWALTVLDNAPTIIQAEEGET